MSEFLLKNLLENPNLIDEDKCYMVFDKSGLRQDLLFDKFILCDEINIYDDKIGVTFLYYVGMNSTEVFSSHDKCWNHLYLKEANRYEQHGFIDRGAYLNSLSEEYTIDKTIVFPLAAMLGEEEDFDGLVSSLEDLM